MNVERWRPFAGREAGLALAAALAFVLAIAAARAAPALSLITALAAAGAVVAIDKDRSRRSRAEIGERTAELELLLVNAPIGLCFFDRELRYVRINARLAEINRLPIEHHLGRTVREIVPAIAPMVEPLLRGVFETGAGVQDVKIDGEVIGTAFQRRTWLFSAYPVRDARGTITSVGVVLNEITERERAEAALRESESRLRRLWESNVIGVMYTAADGRISDANDAVLRMLGRSRADLAAGRVRWTDLTPPDQIHLDERAIADALARGACTPYEKVYLRADGARVPILIGYALLEGSRSDFICFVLDLTEQKRVEAALADQLQLNEILTANAASALFMMDERGYCTFSNPAALAMTGFSAEELRERPLHEILHYHHPDGSPFPIDDCPIVRAVQRGEGLRAHADVFLRKGGEAFPVICSASPQLRYGGRACIVLEVRDVTEQQRGEREREMLLESERIARGEAERASRLKDEFVATLSHELRTPLNAILGFAQLLRCTSPDPEKLARGLSIIERNTRLLNELISDLLDVSRIVSGKIRLTPVPLDLLAVIEAGLDGPRAAAEAKGVTLTVAVGPLRAPVLGDAGRLAQVISNLASNAIKFTPAGGRVEVMLARRAGRAEIVVSDTGQGIAPEFLPSVFERFRQADASAARRHGGLGLGLSIVKHLVELHGGSVRAESEGVGKGATFTVSLPLQREASRDDGQREEPLRWEAPELAGARVLVVDDEPDAREIARRVLEECGAEIVVAASAIEALDALRAHHPDLLVCDIGMPGLDGYELMRRIRAELAPPDRDVPAVALTAFARASDRDRALDAGFSAHVAKPLEPVELLTTVAALARARLRRGC
jgi:PAS domain S-box-containing protein